MDPNSKRLSVFAPAKINLDLHITGKRSDGYHTLDSLICFTDVGDTLLIEPHPSFDLEINGPCAASLSADDHRADTTSTNLVVRAAYALSSIVQKPLRLKITLTKNLPVAAGLGGGSSNAAATIWGLQDFWSLPRQAPYLTPLLKSLGADVLACYNCTPRFMQGIGDILSPLLECPEIPVVLINPMKPCPTANVFLNFEGPYQAARENIPAFNTPDDIITYLKTRENALTPSALRARPEINNILIALNAENGCRLARMSGSGATCFGLFDTIDDANASVSSIISENPDWWIKSGWINRTTRY